MNETMTALDLARLGADTLMRKFPAASLPPAGRFHYHQGVFLSGVENLYLLCGDQKYAAYIRDWVDQFVGPEGELSGTTLDQFDDMQPAILLFRLYDETGDPRYKAALDRCAPVAAKWPTNAKGGFWHKYYRQNQMWLDTLYMIGPLCARYAAAFQSPYFFEKVLRQMHLMRKYMTDSETGLLRHAWDDSKAADWADRATGLSAVSWGRAIGWYVVAILDILDYLPPGHPRRGECVDAECAMLKALLRYQDENDGRWYQVVNRGDDPRNWLENSCSCLFTYALAKGLRAGIGEPAWEEAARRAYAGIVRSLKTEPLPDGTVTLNIPAICVGTGVGDYQFYLERPTVENDLHGMGAFLLMAAEYHRAFETARG
ncbi:MAG: glycoside hydrolase family 88 protein [Treponema sp.]|jgi:unsaturated rhamnogalacturonyl hydrolase|nr:glycoside hydrolase family 88 protein [Treponema sp.]